MLSVDPYMVRPLDAQSLNPYSYVSNNPIMGTDPTGYCEAATGSHIKSCVKVKTTNSEGKTKTTSLNTRSSHDMSRSIDSLFKPASSLGSTGAGNGLKKQASKEDKNKAASDIKAREESGSAQAGDQETVQVTGTDVNDPKAEIRTQKRDLTLTRSDLNAEKGYDSVNDAVLAQYGAYKDQYAETVKNGTELTGLVFSSDGRFYFSTMAEVPAQFTASISLQGIRVADIEGFTHTHPDSNSFNGLDYTTPSGKLGKPFFVRTSDGNAYRWDSAGAKKYARHVAGLQSSGSVMSHDTTIAHPEQYGISNICPGGGACLK